MEKQIYSYDEAYEESLRYFQGDELAARVWVNKYAVKDSFGNIYEKSPEDMHWRIANEVARIEAKYPNALTAKELYDLLDNFLSQHFIDNLICALFYLRSVYFVKLNFFYYASCGGVGSDERKVCKSLGVCP